MYKSMKFAISAFLMAVAALTASAAAEKGAPPEPTAAEMSLRGDALAAAVHARVAQLLADSPHPLFTRHLRSANSLVQADWARSSLLTESDPKTVRRSLEFAQKILDGLYGDAGQWESYAAGNRDMIVAFVSRYDQTLQQYTLRLPRDWDPEKSYPAIVYLHGHVPNVHPLWYSSLPFSPNKAVASAQSLELEPHFSIAPWGRGNTGYSDAGETDVWEVINDVKSGFRLDADRMYLTGHSMGGFGTWSIGVRTPDYWAGMAMYAGGSRGDISQLSGNLASVPLLLWHGEKDPTVNVSHSYAIRDALKAFGNETKMDINPEAGHMVPRGEKTPHKKWLLQQRRRRPDSFQFLSDTPRHRSAWGITLPRIQSGKPQPQFKCNISGNEVRIDSKHANGLDVKLGDGGLGLSGDVTVFWNGEQSYSGPAEDITLGKGAGRSRWSRD